MKKAAAVWCFFIISLISEQWILGEHAMPEDQVLINAVEDARAVVEFMVEAADRERKAWMRQNYDDPGSVEPTKVHQVEVVEFQALRVYGLLRGVLDDRAEKARNEFGGVA